MVYICMHNVWLLNIAEEGELREEQGRMNGKKVRDDGFRGKDD